VVEHAFKNVDVIPQGNGILHQINIERMSPVVQVQDGVRSPTRSWAPTATRRWSTRWA
jgi:aconitase A